MKTWRSGAGGAAAALALSTAVASAQNTTANVKIAPYLAAKASDTGASVDVGPELYPVNGFPFGGRVLFSVKKQDPNGTLAEISTENAQFGGKVQLVGEFTLLGRRRTTKGVDGRLSLIGVQLGGELMAGKFTYYPGAGATATSVFRTSWTSQLRLWWYGSVGELEPVESVEGEVTSGHLPRGARVRDYRAWLFSPQLVLGYGRTWKESDPSYVVRAPDANGLQLAEQVTIDGPTTKPSFTGTLALAFEPPKGQFAFALAGKLSSTGAVGGYRPFGQVGRVRLELWTYYFAFEPETAAVRVGAAPFVDVRTGGTDTRESVVGGAIIELRTGTSRLEY